MRQRLAPMLFDDTDKAAAEAMRSSVVATAQRSQAAVAKQTTRLTPERLPVHSFHSLLADLADLGAAHCHHRHHTKLSAHHTDQANSDPAQGVHPPWRPSVASNTTRQ